MLSKLYLVIGILVIALYGFVTLTGKEFGDPEKQKMPADVRQSPGGYRSFHMWHSGYRGGK
ncbi:MAG TPA: hypothetical protein VNI02_06910 [Blastocatellia bacterium]|jgi:hypothetical protein|nr:hypothetical protein [Blastocatellia bacterium]